MLCTDASQPVPNYKDYKNRTCQKQMEKLNNTLWQIRSSSLKEEDKKNLLQDMINKISEFKV